MTKMTSQKFRQDRVDVPILSSKGVTGALFILFTDKLILTGN